jgi:hypothetical protein
VLNHWQLHFSYKSCQLSAFASILDYQYRLVLQVNFTLRYPEHFEGRLEISLDSLGVQSTA